MTSAWLRRWSCWRIAWGLAWAVSARAMILIGDDETDNRQRPLDGSPWAYVGATQVQQANGVFINDASAVYLGNRYFLTAAHVGIPPQVVLPGGTYVVDAGSGFAVVGGADLGLFRITTDPGLPPMPLVRTNETDLSWPSTLIGCGVGRGVAVPGQGWLWGDLKLRRWGTNTTLDSVEVDDGSRSLLPTAFDLAAGADEAQSAYGDSGGGLFQRHGGTWKLAGLTVAVDDSRSFYDGDASQPGRQPDRTYHERLRTYRDEILVRTGLPDPDTALASWRFRYFKKLAGTGNAADLADPDGDGVPNLLEFAFGLDPLVADAGRLPQAGIATGALEMSFVEPDAVGGVFYAAEESSDLVAWVSMPDVGEGILHRFRRRLSDSKAGFIRLLVSASDGSASNLGP